MVVQVILIDPDPNEVEVIHVMNIPKKKKRRKSYETKARYRREKTARKLKEDMERTERFWDIWYMYKQEESRKNLERERIKLEQERATSIYQGFPHLFRRWLVR